MLESHIELANFPGGEETMPRWDPGTDQNENIIRSEYRIPIVFEMELVK